MVWNFDLWLLFVGRSYLFLVILLLFSRSRTDPVMVPSCVIRDIMSPASTLLGPDLGSGFILLCPPWSNRERFFSASFSSSQCVHSGRWGKSTPSFQQPACLTPCWHRGIESQVTPASAWVCGFRAVYTLELLFYSWSIKTFTCFWAQQYVCAVLNRSLLTCLEPGR